MRGAKSTNALISAICKAVEVFVMTLNNIGSTHGRYVCLLLCYFSDLA